MSQTTLVDWKPTPGREAESEPVPDCLRPPEFRSYTEPRNCYSCPWCLSPPRFFRENRMGQTCCEKCTAVIPIKTEWYRRGEKIVYP